MKNDTWFKAKLYGWGWYPATWQGWLCLGIFLVAVMADMYIFRDAIHTSEEIMYFGLRLTGYIIPLIAISYFKGETPKWRWGK